MRKLVSLLGAVVLSASGALALEIPFTLPERAGLDRLDNHAVAGIPLPEGACKVAAFRLLDADGKAVPAQFAVRERWLKDDSVRFMTVHFLAQPKAGETPKYRVVEAGPEDMMPPSLISVESSADVVTVNTGTVKFTVKKGDWKLFDAVEVGGKALLREPGRVVFKAEHGKTPVAGEKAAPPELGEPKEARAVARELVVEEKGPGRVVVLVKGAFMDGETAKLDFQARYYAMGGSSSVRVAFTIVNRQGKAFDEFVGLRQLGFELPLALEGEKSFAAGASEGKDLEGQLAAADRFALLQPSSIEYVASGKLDARGKCKDLDTKRVGWLSLAGKEQAVTAAVRWFWQLHPKGLEASGDGTLKVWLVPMQSEKAKLPEGEVYSEPLVRIDLYTGGARTHEMLFAFHKPGAAEARARAAGVMEPLFGACAPEWYCQKTFAIERMYDAKLENYRPEVRELIKKYENSVDRSFATVMNRMSGHARAGTKFQSFFPQEAGQDTVMCSAQKCEEYGWMNFGSHCEHNDYVKPGDALNTRWDGNYYDFPQACLVRFARTGMWQYFDAAVQAGMHLADVDICHWHPTDQKLNGIEHTCPNRGHFRQWWPGEPFGVSGNVDSAKSQSLFNLYNLTGEAWYREAGLLSGDYLSVHGGSALRAQGNRMTGLVMSYRASRDEKYKKAWEGQAKGTAAGGIATGGTKGWDQFWMYGLACEGLYNYHRITGDVEAAKGIRFGCDSLMFLEPSMGKSKRGEYDNLAGFSLPGFGYAYELTGEAAYLKHGIYRLSVTANSCPGRSKSFAQHSRISPQFLFYLASDYKAPKPVVGGKAEADPADAAIKECAAAPKMETPPKQ